MKQTIIFAYAFLAMFIGNGAIAAQGDTPSAPKSSKSAPDPVAGTQSAPSAGEIAEAALLCDRLASDPRDKDKPANLSGVEHPPAEAIGYCSVAVTADPQNARLNYQTGRAFRQTGEFAKAFFYFDRANSLGSLRASVAVADAYLFGSGISKDQDKAVDLLKRAASQGDAGAIIQLGQFYSSGPSKNLDLAVNWFSSVDDGEAFIALGDLYFTEIKNDALALKWYRKAAELGMSRAYKKLAWHYFHGRGVPVDFEQAIEWYSLAWGKHPEVAVAIAGSYSRLGDTARMVSWLERGIARGDGPSATQLAWAYQYQVGGLITDIDKAVELYKKAAGFGDTIALIYLGDVYLQGFGVPKDLQLANRYFREALGKGHKKAYYYLGLSYHESGDRPAAIEEFKKSAANGESVAMYYLAIYYRDGIGVKQDYQEALSWFKKSAEEGDKDAMNQVGLFYENGRGVRRDYSEAGRWYEKAGAAGYGWGNSNLAFLFSRGYGVNKDIALAVDLQEMAMKQGADVCARFKETWTNWTPEFVQAFQSRLSQTYNYKGPIDGRLGSGSMAAVDKICAHH